MTNATASVNSILEKPAARRFKYGIRGKLFAAFAAVASLTLVAASVALLSYGRIGDSFERLDSDAIPAIDHALTLARQAAELSAVSATLPGIDNARRLSAVVDELHAKRRDMASTLATLDHAAFGRNEMPQLKASVRDLEVNSDALAETVAQRLPLGEARRRLTSQSQETHRRIIEQLAPLIDDARFNLVMGVETMRKSRDLDSIAAGLSSLSHSELPGLRAFNDLRAEANLSAGLLAQASLTASADLLPPLRDMFIASSHRVRVAADSLGESQGAPALRASFNSLASIGEGADGLFSLRRQELSNLDRGGRLAQESRSKAVQLSAVVERFIAAARANSGAAVFASRQAINVSQTVLVSLAAFSLLVAFAIAWIYIGKGLLRRIENLNATILALANGDLTVEISREGADELSRVASAVEVLKANALLARELEADRERFRIDDLRRREASFRLLFFSNPVPMWVRDLATGGMIAVNDSALSHYGYSREQFLSMAAADLVSPEAGEPAAESVSGGAEQHRKSNGEEIEVAIYERSLCYDGHDAALVAAIDLTERRRAEQRIRHLAFHDALTDLPNRAAFTDKLARALHAASAADAPFAMLCLDLDHFKEINDIYGHAVGDQLLAQLSSRLALAAEGNFVARIGGDEFTVISLEAEQPAAAGALAERLLAAGAETFQINGAQLRVGLSIGVAVFPSDGQDATSLVANADAALYRAKADGRGGARFFEPHMDARIHERHALQHDLRVAIERNELQLYYQPQANVTGEVFGFEALVRWRHPMRGFVSPATFIPIAEESGLIVELGEWVLREACREAASWPKALGVAVNLSPIQFRRGDLAALVHAVLLESGLAPRRLELEITEGVLMQDSSRSLTILRHLKAMGVTISMDDFGTGYSSLSYLQSFPFDKLKIDQSFIAQVETREQSAAIVRAVIGLGRGLNMPVIAEGVETAAQLDFLAKEQCNEIQGYLFGRPAPIDDYAHLVGRAPVTQVAVAQEAALQA